MRLINRIKGYCFKLLTGQDYKNIDFEQMEVDSSSQKISSIYTLDNDKD